MAWPASVVRFKGPGDGRGARELRSQRGELQHQVPARRLPPRADRQRAAVRAARAVVERDDVADRRAARPVGRVHGPPPTRPPALRVGPQRGERRATDDRPRATVHDQHHAARRARRLLDLVLERQRAERARRPLQRRPSTELLLLADRVLRAGVDRAGREARHHRALRAEHEAGGELIDGGHRDGGRRQAAAGPGARVDPELAAALADVHEHPAGDRHRLLAAGRPVHGHASRGRRYRREARQDVDARLGGLARRRRRRAGGLRRDARRDPVGARGQAHLDGLGARRRGRVVERGAERQLADGGAGRQHAHGVRDRARGRDGARGRLGEHEQREDARAREGRSRRHRLAAAFVMIDPFGGVACAMRAAGFEPATPAL